MDELEQPSVGDDCRRAAGRADRLSAAAAGEIWRSGPDDLVSGWYVVKTNGSTLVAYAQTRDNAALMAAYDPQTSNLMAELLRAASADADMVDAINARQAERDGRTRQAHSATTLAAWRLARALLGGAP